MKKIITIILIAATMISAAIPVHPDEIKSSYTEINQFYNEQKELEQYLNKALKKIECYKEFGNKEWFIEYKDVIYEYSNYFDKPETIYDVFTEEDLEYLFRMVETECYGGDFDSKSHVASVAFSRLSSDRFPDTLTKVITKPNQFTYFRKNISDETILACEYAFMIGTEADGCLFFKAGKKTEKFNGANWVMQDLIGHHFYK